MNDLHTRWSWKWGWLLVAGAASLFLYWAACSCYHESIHSKGPGGAITWVVTAGIYGLAYSLLFPAYVWLISPRPLWALPFILLLIILSFVILRWYTASGMFASNYATDWHQLLVLNPSEAVYGPYRLLLSITATVLLVLLGVALRLVLCWQQPSETSATR